MQRLLRCVDAFRDLVEWKVDRDATRKQRGGQLSHLPALIESVVQHDVWLQLLGIWFVNLPPQVLVALNARREARFGESEFRDFDHLAKVAQGCDTGEEGYP